MLQAVMPAAFAVRIGDDVATTSSTATQTASNATTTSSSSTQTASNSTQTVSSLMTSPNPTQQSQPSSTQTLDNLKQARLARTAAARRMALKLGLMDSEAATSSANATQSSPSFWNNLGQSTGAGRAARDADARQAGATSSSSTRTGGRFAALVYGVPATAENSPAQSASKISTQTATNADTSQKPPVNHKGPQFKLADIVTIDKVQLSRLALVQLMLPANTRVLDLPISITGRLEITREGDVSSLRATPLKVLSNLIARKGVCLNLPQGAVLVGEEKESSLPLKIQAEEGDISIIAKSLDLIKVQLFSRTGMHLEVEEKPLHIGRHVESHTTLHMVWNYHCSYPSVIKFLQPGVALPPTNSTTFNITLPYKISNGSYLMTEGVLTMIAPVGVQIDQAEIYARGGDWTVKSKAPVHNVGGKIFVSGNLNMGSIPFKNAILTQNSQWAPYGTILYPVTQRGEVMVGGDLISEQLDNLGSLVHVGGRLVEKHVGPKQEFIHNITWPGGGATCSPGFITPEYPSVVSFGKGASFPEAKNPVLEGVIQGCLMAMHYEGEARVGRYANYRRPAAIKAFKQLQDFNLDRVSALFIPNDDRGSPWLHKPAVPLTWDIQLPPAVGIGKSGLYLVEGPLLYHPLQEIEGLPNAFAEQLKRGYLDGNNTQSLGTYIKGRYAAYDFYLKHFGPKAIGGQPAPERSQDALALADAIDFMVLYRAAAADGGTTVHTPVSCLSSRYDNPQMRNLDGGIFVDRLHMTGAPGSSLRILSTVHGEKELDLTGPHIAVERQIASWWTYHTNITKKKRFLGCSESEETVAIPNTESQPSTGILSTGKGGKAIITADILEQKNGAQMRIGSEGLDVQIGKVIMGPGVDTTVGYSESRAGRNSAVRYFPMHSIQPASITSEGGVTGNVGDLEFRGSNMVALDKDIRLRITGDAALLTHKVQQSLGAVVSKSGGAVTISEGTTEVALPSSIIALNGGVSLSLGGTLRGSAPQFYGKKVDVTAKRINFPIEPLKTQIFAKTTGFTSWTTYVNRSTFETHDHAIHPTIVTQDGAIFRTTDGPAYVEAPLLSGDYIQSAVGGDSILGSASLRHTRDEESTTVSLTNPALACAESALEGDFAGVLKTLQKQFPLLGTIQQLARSNDGASFAEGAMKTLYQSHQFLSSLKSAGSLSRYLQDRMMRVGIGIQEFGSRATWTTAAIPQVLTPSHITLTSVGGSTRAVGLSGTLSNLTMRSDKDLIIEPPLESGESSTSTDGMEISFGFSKDGGSVTVGGNIGSSESRYRTYAHQSLNVLGRTSLIADGDIYLSTPFTTAHSFMDGRQIFANTLQDSQSSAHDSFSGSLGISYGAGGVSPSGSFAVVMGEGDSLRAPHPTVITSTTSSVIRAREKVVLAGASFISHGPGLFASPLTEVYDVMDHTHSESSRFGAEFSGGGAVPGFMEMGFESLNQSARHRSTISAAYTVQGSVGAANRDAHLMYEEGPTDRTHLWFGAPIVANTYEALADMRGGLTVLGQAFSSASNPVTPQRVFAEEVYEDPLGDDYFEADPVVGPLEADFFKDDSSEDDGVDFDDKVEVKPTTKKRTPSRKDALADQARDLLVDSLYGANDTQMLLFDIAAEEPTSKKPSKSRTHMESILDNDRKAVFNMDEVFKEALNHTLDDFSSIPTPVGVVCAAATMARDLYQGTTSVEGILIGMAVEKAGLKAAQGVIKGVKNVIMSAKEVSRKITQGFTALQNNRVEHKVKLPFVDKPKRFLWYEAKYSDDLICHTSENYNSMKPYWTQHSNAPFVVFGHGNQQRFFITSQNVHPKALSQENLHLLKTHGNVSLNATQLARFIVTSPQYNGQHIHLHSCLVGALPNGIAQQLATRMHVQVSGPREALHIGSRSFVVQSIQNYKNKVYELGEIVTFYPQKR